MKQPYKTQTTIYGAALLLLSLTACGGMIKKLPEEAVRDRAAERWGHLIKGDMRKAYELSSPSSRAVVSFEQYRGKFGGAVAWRKTEITSVTCETDKCTAKVRIEAEPLLGTRFGNTLLTYVDETWLLEDGQWWFFQKL